MTTVGIIAIIAYSIYSVLHGTMSIGNMSLYISLALSTGGSFSSMLNHLIGHLQYCIPQVNEFLKFIQYENKIKYNGY